MKNIISGALLILSIAENVLSMEVRIDRHLDNVDCKKGVTFRPWEEAYARAQKDGIEIKEQGIKFIILHYTAGGSVDSAYNAYNYAGVSAHYTIDYNGAVYLSVDPDKYIAFHAGSSYFGGYERLNYYSVGIEHVNPGCRDEYIEYKNFENPIQIPGDSRYWYPFDDDQFENSCEITKYLQDKFKVAGWNVVTHADITPRKIDIGPNWKYKDAFTNYNVGFWYNESHQINSEIINRFTDDNYVQMINAIGYTSGDNEQTIKAYKMHYICSEISNELTNPTKEAILKHVISLKDYHSYGQKYAWFEEQIQKVENISELSEYFVH